MSVKLITITPDAERHIAHCARVSSDYQNNPDYAGLLKYCLKHGHVSVFEQATATFELTTTVAIAMQLLRHKSFDPQMLSRRYSSKALDYQQIEARQQATKNRQSSTDACADDVKVWFNQAQQVVWETAYSLYEQALTKGIAREQARFLLPQNTETTLYWTGNIRSFIHWIELRTAPETQKEHRVIAEACKALLSQQLPVIATTLQWI